MKILSFTLLCLLIASSLAANVVYTGYDGTNNVAYRLKGDEFEKVYSAAALPAEKFVQGTAGSSVWGVSDGTASIFREHVTTTATDDDAITFSGTAPTHAFAISGTDLYYVDADKVMKRAYTAASGYAAATEHRTLDDSATDLEAAFVDDTNIYFKKAANVYSVPLESTETTNIEKYMDGLPTPIDQMVVIGGNVYYLEGKNLYVAKKGTGVTAEIQNAGTEDFSGIAFDGTHLILIRDLDDTVVTRLAFKVGDINFVATGTGSVPLSKATVTLDQLPDKVSDVVISVPYTKPVDPVDPVDPSSASTVVASVVASALIASLALILA